MFESFNEIQIKHTNFLVASDGGVILVHLAFADGLEPFPVGSVGSFSFSASPSSQNTALPSAMIVLEIEN